VAKQGLYMKIIRCTKKLLKEAGIAVTDQPVSPSSWLESWHANLVIIDRCKCLLVTNDESFYTLFIPGLKKSDFKNLKLIINEHLFKSMVYDGLPQSSIEKILAVGDELFFPQTNNRSVLGTMNDMKFALEHRVYANGGMKYCKPLEFQHTINSMMPLGPLKYGFSLEVFKKKLL
jgi:hypothetical protein